jgi:hypothetical protein
MYKYNWFNELIYRMILLGGDEEDIIYITNYRNKCIELGVIRSDIYKNEK